MIKTQKEILMARAYELYCEYELANHINDSLLYKNKWCIQIGMAIMHPHPTRHFTKDEYYDMIEKDMKFAKFACDLWDKARQEYYDGITNRINEGGL